MKEIYETRLGDSWVIRNGYAQSEQTGQHYYLSDAMERIITGAELVESADPRVLQYQTRMSNRLREIEQAPLTPDGRCFLIADRESNALWSHPVKITNPQFDWHLRDSSKGIFLVMTEDPEVAIQSYVGNAAMNEKEPGSGDDVFNVMVFDHEEEEYCIAHQASSFAEAQDYILSGGRMDRPLPWLGYETSSFMDIPAGEELGFKGMYAELQLRSEVTDGFRHQQCEMHIMDQHGRCVASTPYGVNGLMEIRDNPEVLKECLADYKHEDKLGLLHNFKNSEVFEPEDIDELLDAFSKLYPSRFLKFQTPDDNYQLLISYELVPTYRDSNTARRIHTGPGSPSEEALRESGCLRLTVGEERSYTVVVKHTEGAMTRTLSNVILHHETLFRLISDEEAMEELIERTRLKPLSFADNLKTGDAPCMHQLLGASMQGRVFDIQYAHSKHVKIEELLGAFEAKRQQMSTSMSPC